MVAMDCTRGRSPEVRADPDRQELAAHDDEKSGRRNEDQQTVLLRQKGDQLTFSWSSRASRSLTAGLIAVVNACTNSDSSSRPAAAT